MPNELTFEALAAMMERLGPPPEKKVVVVNRDDYRQLQRELGPNFADGVEIHPSDVLAPGRAYAFPKPRAADFLPPTRLSRFDDDRVLTFGLAFERLSMSFGLAKQSIVSLANTLCESPVSRSIRPTKSQRRLACKRFIREEVARRRRERLAR